LYLKQRNTRQRTMKEKIKKIAYKFFWYLQNHKNGILGIIIIHLIIINILLLSNITSYEQPAKKKIIIDFEKPEKKEEKQSPKKQNKNKKEIDPDKIAIDNINYSNHAKNLAQLKKAEENLYGDRASSANKKASSSEYKKEVIKNALSDKAYKEYMERQQRKKREEKEKPTNTKPSPKEPPKDSLEGGQKKVYKGPTTITYYLEERVDVYLPVPVYKCEEGGIVSVRILVNQDGKVVSAKIRDKENFSHSECLQEAALSAAQKTIFNNNLEAPQKQKGKITYQFIPQ